MKDKFSLKVAYFKKVGVGLSLINFIVQRIFRVNGKANFSVNFTSRVIHANNIRLSPDLRTLASFALSGGCYIQAVNGIILGKNFLFGPGVKIISANHDFLQHNKSTPAPPIIIGDNVWVGANAVILPGVRLGNNCIVGAGSVVTKSFSEDNLIVAGNPAKIIGKITSLKET